MTSKTVASIVGKADWVFADNTSVDWTFPLKKQFVGVELEVDCDNSNAHDTVFPKPEVLGHTWQRKTDGSLSNGYEYVLRSPLAGDALAGAVFRLFSNGTKVHRTYTGSTHIHLDMTDGVPAESLRVLLLLTYAFETYLYAVGDITRQWCGYANRLMAAPSDVLEAILGGEELGNFNRAVESAGRYYGLNLCALSKFGSVEFRYFPTAESPEELLSWINLCQKFKKASIEIGSVENLLAMLKTKDGYNSLLEGFFGEDADRMKELCPYSRVRSLTQKALIIAQSSQREPSAYRYARVGNKYEEVLRRYGYIPQQEPQPLSSDAIIYHSVGEHDMFPEADATLELYPHSLNVLIRFTGDIFVLSQHRQWGTAWLYVPDLAYEVPEVYEQVMANRDAIEERALQLCSRRLGAAGNIEYSLRDRTDTTYVQADEGDYEEEEYPDEDYDSHDEEEF